MKEFFPETRPTKTPMEHLVGEESIRKRRPFTPQHTDPLSYRLVVLLRSRKEVKIICTHLSIAIRTVILCDLANGGFIALDTSGCVFVRQMAPRPVEGEFTYKISQLRLPPGALLKALNGEKAKEVAVTNLRKKIHKEMESRRILHTKKTLLYNKTVLDDFAMWNRVFSTTVEECRAGALSRDTLILLVALDYVNSMESLLIQCNEADTRAVVESLRAHKQRILSGEYPPGDSLVYELLRCLVKK